MIAIKLVDVTVFTKRNKRVRHNQNYSMVFWRLDDGVGPDTTVEDLKKIITDKYSNRVCLNENSEIRIMTYSYIKK